MIRAAAFSFARLALVLMLVLEVPTESEARSDGGVTVIGDQASIERFTHALQESLSRVTPTGKILSCDTVVRSNEYSGRDEIYGASCLVSIGGLKPLRLLMCDDMMVGKFTLTSQYFWGIPSLDVIGSFVRANCPAGG